MTKLPKFAVLPLKALVLSLFLCACGASHTEEELLQRAKSSYARGDVKEAIIDLKTVASQNPDSSEARLLLGKVYLEVGDAQSAEKEIRKAMELGIPEQQTQPLLVKSLLLQSKFDEVLDEGLIIANDMRPTDEAYTLAVIGQAFTARNETKKALLAFDQSLELDPSCLEAIVGMSSLYSKMQQPEDSRQWNSRALAVDDTSVAAWSQLGKIELDDGNLEEAEVAFSQAVRLSKYVRIDLAMRAFVRFNQQQYEDAENDVNKLLNSPYAKHPYVTYLRGLLAIRKGDNAEAEEYFEDVLNVLPEHLPSKIQLTSVFLAQGEYEQARVLAEQIVAKLPDSVEGANLLGRAHLGRLDYKAAKEALRASLRGSSKDSVALSVLGKVALMQGETQEAVDYFTQASVINPDSEQNAEYLMLARIMNDEVIEEGTAGSAYNLEILYAINLLQRGDVSGALEQGKRLHEEYPGEVEPLNIISACYVKSSDWSGARPFLDKALSLDPVNPSAVKNLARIEVIEGQMEKAGQMLKDYLSVVPQDAEAIQLLVKVEDDRGDPNSAERILTEAVQNNPGDPNLLFDLVQRNVVTGDAVKVIALTQELPDRVVTQRPGLLEFRGKSQMTAGQFESAAVTFGRLVEILPDNAKAHLFYGDSLIKARQPEAALKQYDTAYKLDTTDMTPRIRKAGIYLQQADLDKARREVAEITMHYGDDAYPPDALWVDGWLAMLEGDYSRAERQLTAADEQLDDSLLTLLLARVLSSQEKYDQANSVMMKRLEQSPQDLSVLMETAALLLAQDKPEQARQIYQKVVEYYPGHSLALNNLAFLSREVDPKQALGFAERAYEISPQNVYVLDTLGTLLTDSGDLERAENLLRQAVATVPENASFMLHLAELLLQNGQRVEAEALLNKVINVAPDSDSAKISKQLLQQLAN